ncbi:hypothetical protein LOD99_8232 [Oopsacas minuta]|uniref:Uncharacterized protein n=1 Tax=Oopsacas minuta TaxID=111878 RepID=A0AAV7JIB2_9METZ|nr:hypothetical protein LOD99_8232 [Oopsacas minuta]
MLSEMGMVEFPHPPYSLDLSPCDFCFQIGQKALGSDLPVPIFTEFVGPYDDEDGANSEEVNDHDCEYDVDFQGPSSEPSLFNQAELNDLIRDLDLLKESSEFLTSRLKEKNLLHQGTNVTLYRYREQEFQQYFCEKNGLVESECVLLHNGNIFGSIPIGYSVKLKEEYNNVKGILEIISYSAHDWVICVDLKMVNFLSGQQSGFTKYPCFLCYWDSRDGNQHWIREKWPPRECLKVGDKNVINNPLVHTNKIILPPLHIKLGLMKQFIKALDQDILFQVYPKLVSRNQ